MNDVVVVVKRDTVPLPADTLDILLILTDAEKEAVTYTSLSAAEADLGKDSIGYKKIEALFSQGNARPAPEKLIQSVKVVGFADITTPETLVAAIKEYQKKDNDWYFFMTDQTEGKYIEALAEFAEKSEPTEMELNSGVEDHRKFYFCQTSDKAIQVSHARTAIIYTDNLDYHAEASWIGAVGPWYPKYVTWKFKMPAGIKYPALTADERKTFEDNYINFVTNEYKRNYIKNGICSDGEFIDSVIGGDWLAKEIRGRIYDVFMDNPIIPYGDNGFTQSGAAVLDAMNAAVDNGIIAINQETNEGVYSVSIPKWEESTEEQRRKRIMPDIAWEAQLTGAVHSAKVKGTLSVEL
ncbi:DUF3383 family protein [Anaerobutyricum hallii]|uniref:DUF3383 family protein n=1 Tax=Anaerobutyricum hallii TaxID=39488 RepID=UPI000E73E6EB|nr:DUF3383 family protein [Anaerobutyricum hallii]RJW41949.1 DUF3383 family protein [Lachnospiraceae bacterium TF09-5]